MKYDFLIVGSGLFGAICAYEAHKKRQKTLVIDKRSHIAGNIYTEKIENIDVHQSQKGSNLVSSLFFLFVFIATFLHHLF